MGKKISNKQRRHARERWLIERDRENLKWRTARKRHKRSFYPGSLQTNEHTKGSVYQEDKCYILSLPEQLDFEENYESTVSHFQLIRAGRTHANPQKLKSVDYSAIRFISASAALVLASEIDRWRQRRGKLKANTPTWHPDILRLLYQMGYFELLLLPKPIDTKQPAKTIFLPFKRGEVPEKDPGQLAKKLRIEVEELVGFSIKKQILFEGLSEAITNVSQHAYPKEKPGVRQWWLSASFDSESKILTVTFYDQGEGIPKTLPRWRHFSTFAEDFKLWSDSRKIEAAMEVGRSATGQEHRGKGLQNFLQFASHYSPSRLSICSLRGMFRMNFNPNETGPRLERRDLKNSIGGTLIEWAVTLK